jgi:membrane associated rhomboid family serine protease
VEEGFDGGRSREPVFNAPTVVVAILAVLVLAHVGRSLLSAEADFELLARLAFIPARLTTYLPDIPGGPWAWCWSLITHQVLHGDLTHLVVNSAWLLVFGSITARRIGVLRLVLLALASGVAGALAFWALHPNLVVTLVGASGAISGLMGGAFRFLLGDGGLGAPRMPGARPEMARRLGIGEALADRRVAGATMAFLLVNLLIAVGVSMFAEAGAIAWEAHIGGFALGFLAFGWFDLDPAPAAGDDHVAE